MLPILIEQEVPMLGADGDYGYHARRAPRL